MPQLRQVWLIPLSRAHAFYLALYLVANDAGNEGFVSIEEAEGLQLLEEVGVGRVPDCGLYEMNERFGEG